MRAILEFDLPEEQSEYDMAHNAGVMFSTLWEVMYKLREEVKYNMNCDGKVDAQTIRQIVWDGLEGTNLDMP